jgi:hypothetical protein
MIVRFVCGHVIEIVDDDTAPECPQCHETRVERVQAPAPRFRGAVSGPSATKIEGVKP